MNRTRVQHYVGNRLGVCRDRWSQGDDSLSLSVDCERVVVEKTVDIELSPERQRLAHSAHEGLRNGPS